MSAEKRYGLALCPRGFFKVLSACEVLILFYIIYLSVIVNAEGRQPEMIYICFTSFAVLCLKLARAVLPGNEPREYRFVDESGEAKDLISSFQARLRAIPPQSV